MPLPRVSLRPAPSAALQRPRVGAASRARRTVCPRAEAAAPAAGSSVSAENPITLTPTAIKHLTRLRDDNGGDSLCLRMGVKSGGCSGLSYAMDFEDEANIKEDDHVMEQGGIKLVTDPKSLLYLFGMSLDYSTDLIGGGFQFHNPNAESSCGCGKSFGV